MRTNKRKNKGLAFSVRRNNRGRYAKSYWQHFSPLLFLGISMLVSLLVQKHYQNEELINPCENDGCSFFMVRAYEEPIKAEIEVIEQPKTIEQMILDTFKEDGELMLNIAKCESGLNPKNIGDQHLMGWLDGELTGDSVGLFQIRLANPGTYEKATWNRAKANGMTATEFRAWLQVPENNIKYAYEIYKRQGLNAWWNCSQKVK